MKWLLCSVLTLIVACTETSNVTEPIGSQTEALVVGVGPRGVAYDYYASPSRLPHGVTGDERLVFVPHPLNQGVMAVDRYTGQEVASLPAPANGFALPFAVRITPAGRLAVLDSGGFPSPTLQAIARIYEYSYSFNPITRAFSASLVRTISFQGLPIVFTEDLEVLPNGGYVVSESVIGGLWYVSPSGIVSPGILPASFAPGAGVPALGPCAFTPTTVNGVPFTTAGNFAPGVGSLAVRDGELFFGSTCTGGIWKVPVASLTDSRSPSARAADIVRVANRPSGVLSESLKGLAFNRFNPSDRFLYVGDALQGRIIRINTSTGSRQLVVENPQLFDFPVAATFLPPVAGLSPLVVASDQEQRVAGINALLTANQLQPPFIVSKVYVVP